MHLDNQFQMLREDMPGELRNDLKVAGGSKQGKRVSLRLKNLVFHGVDCGTEKKRKQVSIALRCYQGLPDLSGMTQNQRKKYYADSRDFLKRMSLECLLNSKEIVAFATVDRNGDLLPEDPLLSCFRFSDTRRL